MLTTQVLHGHLQRSDADKLNSKVQVAVAGAGQQGGEGLTQGRCWLLTAGS